MSPGDPDRLGGGATPFARALSAYGFDRCGFKGETLLVGLGRSSFAPPPVVPPVAGMPDRIGTVLFLDAPDQVPLIAAFLASPEAQKVRGLDIGSSLDVARHGRLDHAPAIAQLKGKRLPALRSLRLGDMFLTYNGHPGFGRIGDIAPVFDAAPALTSLELFGHFDLSRPVRHQTLERLEAQVDMIGISHGPPSQASVTNLLISDFPALTALELDLDDEDPSLRYDLPARFLTGAGMPRLRSFEMTNTDISGWRPRAG